MSAKNIDSDRKRSRPLTKSNKIDTIKRNRLLFGISLIVIVIIIIAGLYLVYFQNKASGNPIAIIDTSMGTIKVELYEDKMPITLSLQMMVFIMV